MKYPIGIQSFKEIRNGGYAYVDKTALLYNLVSTGKYYFLSRPRRFGKSLLVSTLDAYFSGRKELFAGLAVERLEADWEQYPVLHLDLSGTVYSSKDVLDQKISRALGVWEQQYNIKNPYTDYGVRFSVVISEIHKITGKNVVVIIDEYDKPILDNIDDTELQDYFRTTLQGFYSAIKENDSNIRFGFLTGVTKIGKMSVFSTLNNLTDISFDDEFSGICGISETELRHYFDDGVTALAQKNGLTQAECYARLAEQYDGYHFSEESEGMYNPFSLLSALRKGKFGDYWFETGTPTALVKVIKKTSFDITSLERQQVESLLLTTVDSVFDDPVPLLFQSGYLTIKSYEKEYGGAYNLGFPNAEVKRGFLNYLMMHYVANPVSGKGVVRKLTLALANGQTEEFMAQLSAFFANINYQIQGDAERDFQYAMYVIVALLGIDIEAERATSNGRIDLTIKTDKFIYVIEIKIDKSAAEALAQIEEKGYAAPFAADGRQVVKIGVNFSTQSRSITEWVVG